MKKKYFKGALAVALAATLTLTGCGSKEEPQKAVQDAFVKSAEMKSYSFSSNFKVDDLQFNGTNEQTSGESMVANLLNNAELSISGVGQMEPMQVEATIDVAIKGDMSFTFSFPFSMTEEKMYIKIPNIPMLTGVLPAELVGKFIEMDLNELAKEQGQQSMAFTAEDFTLSQKLNKDIFSNVMTKFDEKTYYKTIDVKKAKLEDGIKAKNVIKMAVTNDNFEEFTTTLLKDALPALMDIMAKDEYKKLFQIEPTEIEKMKKELKTADSDIQKSIDDMKKEVKVNDISMLVAIDKDGYPVQQSFVTNIESLSKKSGFKKIVFHVTSTISNINKKQEFKIGTPTDAIPMNELEKSLNGLMGSGL